MKSTERRLKFCPKCGGKEVFWASGLPQLWSVWECRECGYRGSLVIEDSKLAEKIRMNYLKRKDEDKSESVSQSRADASD